MNDRQEKFFSFPLFLIRPLMDQPRSTLLNIFHYGFYRYAIGITLDKERIANRLIYSYYTDGPIDYDLINKLIEYEDNGQISKDEDYRGFDGNGNFNSCHLDDFLRLLNDDKELLSLAYRHAQIETALYNLKTYYNTTIYDGIRKEESWFNFLTIPDKEPFPQISIKILVSYLNGDYSEGSLKQLAAYIAIGSILGKSNYKSTNKEFIAARMIGYKSPKLIPPKQRPTVEKITNRYHFERLRDLLELNWNFRFYSVLGMKGFYVGESSHLKDMAEDYQRKMKKNQMEQIKADKQKATKQALYKYNPDKLGF